jgi:serine/threonine protein kinase
MALELQPGETYGEFEILEVLGSGGFGQVYKVRDPRFAEPLALKLSLEPVRSLDTAQRTLREVTVLRSLSNAHVVRIFDCGLRSDGHVYVLMELLHGKPLDEFHDLDMPLEPVWAAHIIYQACLGLCEAHDLGIIHRDLKPANVFVDPDARTRILDFGLARSFDSRGIVGANATVGHMLVGTPHYAQPEQLETYALTPAADVYSLGMMLYELLSGRVPFVADDPVSVVRERWRDSPVMWLRAHATAPVIPLRQYLPASVVSDGLAAAVERALAKAPADRFADARGFAHALRAAWPG